MAEPKHTPGPWTIVGPVTLRGFRLPQPSIVGPDGNAVVGWPGFDGLERTKAETVANARLIAAAPELLEACKTALAEQGETILYSSLGLAALKRAIAQAEGRP